MTHVARQQTLAFCAFAAGLVLVFPLLTEYPQVSSTAAPTETASQTLPATNTSTATSTPTEQDSPTPSSTPVLTPTFSPTSTPSATSSATLPLATPTPSATPSPSATQTSSPTPSPFATSTTTPSPLRSLLINEIAWAGTVASAWDEWIELYNPISFSIPLKGWILTDGGDIEIRLQGTIPPHGYFLLERSDDGPVADIPANMIYTGSLRNSGEILRLLDPGGFLVDSANADGGTWPAGDSATRRSMERRPGPDTPANWGTCTGDKTNGQDSDGNPIAGTPMRLNSILRPTPEPTPIPRGIVINEVLIRPHYDWEGDGDSSTADEFIELYNRGAVTVNLEGWVLDDIPGRGSRPFVLPQLEIRPGGFVVLFKSLTGIALNDSGDTVRLLGPDRRSVDKIRYWAVRSYNLSYGRVPDGSRHLYYGLWPTPGRGNRFFHKPTPNPHPVDAVSAEPPASWPRSPCRSGTYPVPLLPRLSRYSPMVRMLIGLQLARCREAPWVTTLN